MCVLTLSVFFHVLSIHGVIWEGAAVAWVFAMIGDVTLAATAIICFTGRKGSKQQAFPTVEPDISSHRGD